MWFFTAIEWFFNLFLSKKANEVKQKAFLERQKAILNYNQQKNIITKIKSKYSKPRRNQKL